VRLLRARAMRRTARDIGIAARMAARLQAKLQRIEYRIADAQERRLLCQHLQVVQVAAGDLDRLRVLAEQQAGITDHTLPDGRIVRR
jgi:hypothetical protein